MTSQTYNSVLSAVQGALQEPQMDASRQPVVVQIDGEVMADSRDVAAYFGKEHKHVLEKIRNMECSDHFRRSNFRPFYFNGLEAEGTSHVLMTKNGFAFVVLGFTGAKAAKFKEEYILRFDAMEAQLRHPRPAAIDFSDPKVLLGAFQHLQSQVAEKEQVIAELSPKADALDRLAGASGSMCITDAAKTLKKRPSDLIAFMSARQWIYKRPGNSSWLGYQSKIQAGFMEHKDHIYIDGMGQERVSTRALVTAKGLAKLAELLEQPLH